MGYHKEDYSIGEKKNTIWFKNSPKKTVSINVWIIQFS